MKSKAKSRVITEADRHDQRTRLCNAFERIADALENRNSLTHSDLSFRQGVFNSLERTLASFIEAGLLPGIPGGHHG